MKRIIFVEGADKSGKSSVAVHLAQNHGFYPITKYPSFKGFKAQSEFFLDHLYNLARALDSPYDNIVIDRSVLTTLINMELDNEENRAIKAQMFSYLKESIPRHMKTEFTLIIMDSPQRVDDEFITKERREKLRALYKDSDALDLFHNFFFGDIIRVNNEGSDLRQMLRDVEDVLELPRFKWPDEIED
jgi:thymidylate kinase